MNRSLTEQKVLKKLNIENFRYLTKDKVITMASMLDKMDPEVAKKALEQFPDFASTAKELLNGYRDILNKGLDSNKESVNSYYELCNSIIASLQKQLESESLSFEDKKYVMDKMAEISRMVKEKDSENKKFIIALSVIAGAAVTVVSATLASALGNNTKFDAID